MFLVLKFILLIFSIQLLICPTLVLANIRDGLIGWWALDEGTGTNAANSKWGGNAGTLTNTPTWIENCPRNKCLNFVTASSQYVDITGLTSDANFIGTSNVTFSVSLWFNANVSLTTAGMLITKGQRGTGTPNNGGWAINFSGSTQTVNFAYKDGAGSNVLQRNTLTTGLNDGKWHHLVVVVTANSTSSTGQDIQDYLDGVSNQDTLTNTAAVAASVPASSVLIGRRQAAGSELYFGGKLDDVHIYNRALTSQEIKDLYNQGIRLFYAPGT